jgi:hypothetical protein
LQQLPQALTIFHSIFKLSLFIRQFAPFSGLDKASPIIGMAAAGVVQHLQAYRPQAGATSFA